MTTDRRTQVRDLLALLLKSGNCPAYLTPVQWDIVRWRANGWTEEAVANELHITPQKAALLETMAMTAMVAKAREVAEATG